jgi:uncharacterized membrane protein
MPARIAPVDAARGAAMILSCLAHFAWWLQPASQGTTDVLAGIAMIATPMFLLLSGTMTGLLLSGGEQGRVPVRYVLLNRGLFLLIFGHVLVSLAEAHRSGGILRTLPAASIVDDIGLALVFIGIFQASLSQERTRTVVARVALAAYAFVWIALLMWPAEPNSVLVVKQALIGPNPHPTALSTYTAPSLQYLTFYFMGLPLGDIVRHAMARPDYENRLARSAFKAGAVLVGGVLVLRMFRVLIDRAGAAPSLDWTLSITAKIPPSPAYLAFYVGLALFIISGLFRLAQRRGPLGLALIAWLAVIGRASLFCFVLQYFLVWTLPDLLNLRPSLAAAPALFIAVIAILWLAARAWMRLRGNRWFTVGLKPPATTMDTNA